MPREAQWAPAFAVGIADFDGDGNEDVLLGQNFFPSMVGMPRFDALIDACHKRARPIFMTSIAMGAGMLPTAIGMGVADASFRSPMAVAVIGGLITSTLLSLVVIPVVYTFADDVEELFKRGRKNPV